MGAQCWRHGPRLLWTPLALNERGDLYELKTDCDLAEGLSMVLTSAGYSTRSALG